MQSPALPSYEEESSDGCEQRNAKSVKTAHGGGMLLCFRREGGWRRGLALGDLSPEYFCGAISRSVQHCTEVDRDGPSPLAPTTSSIEPVNLLPTSPSATSPPTSSASAFWCFFSE